ncbi:hypothetical protein ACQPX6_25610 [Actinomycetospora sp. CA-101289]|uniref:hypothetical protein n=1 Tax=Actinomycetospora sp. CA-101289 TaxID=3239893 RepID=UPI003D96CE8A
MPWAEWSDPLRARRWWIAAVVGLAVLVAALLLVLRSPTFTATATAVVAVPSVAGRPGPSPGQVARSAVGLAATPSVRSAAADAAAVPAGRAGDVAVSASDGGIVAVVADGPSPPEASRLAGATATAVGEALARLDDEALRAELAPLEAQLADVTATLRATPFGDPVRGALEQRYAALADTIADRTAAPSPRLLPDGEPVVTTARSPLAEALLAALAVLVLAVVGGLVARGLGGEHRGRARRDRTLALARVEGPHAVLHPGDDVPAVLTRLYADVVRGRGAVLVLQLARPGARDLGRDLVEAARIVGDDLPHHDLTAGPAAAREDPTAPRVVSLRRPRADDTARALVHRDGVRAALVAVDTRRAVPARLADAVSVLDGLAVEVRGVVVWRGRFPRGQTPPIPPMGDARDGVTTRTADRPTSTGTPTAR